MTRRPIAGFLGLWLLLVAPALAQSPRVALLLIEKGTIELNGKALQRPQLLAQGDRLNVSAGASARLQLIGSDGEISVVGPRRLVIDQRTLSRLARPVPRGEMAVMKDLGNVARGSVATARTTRPRIHLRTPRPTADSTWLFPIELSPRPASPETFSWLVEAVSPSQASEPAPVAPAPESVVARGESSTLQETLLLRSPKLLPGQLYRCRTRWGSDSDEIIDWLVGPPFRLLTAAEQEALRSQEKVARRRAEATGGLSPLLQQAALYLAWDQPFEAGRMLSEAKQLPAWSSSSSQLRQEMQQLEERLRGPQAAR